MRDVDGRSRNGLYPVILESSDNAFIQDVYNGLRAIPKYLPEEYLHDIAHYSSMEHNKLLDASGFDKIIRTNTNKIFRFLDRNDAFKIIDLEIPVNDRPNSIIELLISKKVSFEYIPLSNSSRQLEQHIVNTWKRYPNINIFPLLGDRFDLLEDLKSDTATKIVSTINNTSENQTFDGHLQFVQRLSSCLNLGDMALLGFNLKQKPETIISCYKQQGSKVSGLYHRYLDKVNKTLAGDADLKKFAQHETYDPESGIFKCFLISLANCNITLSLINENITLKKWETILMETFKLFDEEELIFLELCSGFCSKATLHDRNLLQSVVFWKKNY